MVPSRHGYPRASSLTDVARIAGVSKMTVSRVINNHPHVNPDTVVLVKAALARQNYEVKPAESDGRRRRSRSRLGLHHGRVAVLFPDTDLNALRTPLSGRLLAGIDRRLKAHHLQMLITGLPSDRTIPHFLSPRHVDGVIIRTGFHQDWLPAAVVRAGVSAIWMLEAFTRTGVDEVLPDNALLAHLAAARFRAEPACRRVLVVRDQERHASADQRQRALVEELVDGPSLEVLDLSDEPFTRWTSILSTAFCQGEGPIGVFIPGTGMVISAACQAASQVPTGQSRLRLVGCSNDAELLATSPFPLTNLDVGAEAIGDAAVDLLLRRLGDPDADFRSVLIRPTEDYWP